MERRVPTLGRLWFASVLFGLVGCTGANPSQPGASGLGAPGTAGRETRGVAGGSTTDRGERSFGAEPIGGVVVETTPQVGTRGVSPTAPGTRGSLRPAPEAPAASADPRAPSDAAPARVVR